MLLYQNDCSHGQSVLNADIDLAGVGLVHIIVKMSKKHTVPILYLWNLLIIHVKLNKVLTLILVSKKVFITTASNMSMIRVIGTQPLSEISVVYIGSFHCPLWLFKHLWK